MAESKRKAQILKDASILFRKRGYPATSMRDIAAELKIEAPSLYNHIKGKQEILQLLLLDLAQAFTDGMNRINDTSLSSRFKLERIIKLHVDLTIQNPDGMALLTSDWIHLEEPAFSRFAKMREEYELSFRIILKETLSVERKEAANIDLALFSILSTLRWLYSWYLKNPQINPIELEKEMIENLLSGIFKRF